MEFRLDRPLEADMSIAALGFQNATPVKDEF